MKAEEIKELAKLFDSKLTKHPVSSEELQSVLTDFGTILIVNLTTTQPQPSMSAEDIDKLVEKYELNVDSFTSCFLVDKDILINICNEYRNQPVEQLEPQDIINARNEAYKKAGHNAYFGNGFEMGVQFGLKYNQTIEVKHPINEQEEADRLVKTQGAYWAEIMMCHTIQALQLRGLSTEFEEKVLTILKGR